MCATRGTLTQVTLTQITLTQAIVTGRGTLAARRCPTVRNMDFLRKLPPNAIVGPGYTFVPGVGILGASCDLPTSACTNEYRDVK